ncbi:uncharacterized protein LOC131657122 [Vicia villosa]|uniref:uncharacterized protein LOC131657122 n=1 Tax=Vicia villosa TaxID=3911 RepID=UPI00273CF193|nr:uncharacterized protein LOC131657115 isoform X2 [Vicia villosa]XP_058782592.1 uncharacterized protein LOC131657122 [Vicia villosa]
MSPSEPRLQLLDCANKNQTSKPMNSRRSDTDDTYKRKKGMICQLPWDVLDEITQTLDFEDLFQFSGVCKNWRTFHKSNFLSSQEPLLVEIWYSRYPRWGPKCFNSLSNKKVYNLDKIMNERYKITPTYITYSSGYFVILEDKFTFQLHNPFTRTKKVSINLEIMPGLLIPHQ